MGDPMSVDAVKRALRLQMRDVRVAAARSTDAAARTHRLVERLEEVARAHDAHHVMAYDAVPGEPDLTELIDRFRADGRRVAVPAATPTATFPAEPTSIDLVIVPGLAFSVRGDRLGQGGGWYDRFLAARSVGCLAVGACFDEQIVDAVPVGDHDVAVDVVVTDRRRLDRAP